MHITEVNGKNQVDNYNICKQNWKLKVFYQLVKLLGFNNSFYFTKTHSKITKAFSNVM